MALVIVPTSAYAPSLFNSGALNTPPGGPLVVPVILDFNVVSSLADRSYLVDLTMMQQQGRFNWCQAMILEFH